MAYNFKNLNEVDRQDKPTENTTIMAFESGNPRQIPAGEFGGKGLVVDLRGYTINTNGDQTVISDMVYDPIYEAIAVGQNVVFQMTEADSAISFISPLASLVLPGEGFVVMIFNSNGPNILLFTNGSYHSAA